MLFRSLAATNTGTTTVTTGDASLAITANAAAGNLTVNAAALAEDKSLTLIGGANAKTATVNDLVADLVGCCEGGPADLSSNPAHLAGFGER